MRKFACGNVHVSQKVAQRDVFHSEYTSQSFAWVKPMISDMITYVKSCIHTRSPMRKPGAREGAEVRRRKTRLPIVFDDFIGLAFQRGIGAMRPAEKVCRSVGRTCDGHAKSSRVKRDGCGGARAPSPASLPFSVRDRGR